MALFDGARLRRLGTFCYVWLMLGFFSGTLLLVGPVRWITAYLRNGGFRQSTEDAVMIGVIALYVLVSALLAWAAVRWMGRCPSRRVRLSVPLLLTVAAGVALYGWTNPALMAGVAGGVSGSVDTGRAEFVFGPYPDRARLEELKADGYTAVVSLQHPAVLPFEPPGIAEEMRVTSEIGLSFIHAPMLPWISNNDEALDRIRAIARKGEGRYYVHCGLGRDRANVVKRMLEREGAAVEAGDGFKAPGTFAARMAEGNEPMERGQLQQLGAGVWMVPYPNKHEMFGNMLSGQVAHVMLVLDPGDPAQRDWLIEARQRFEEYGVAYTEEPPPAGDPARAAAIVERARALPTPLIIVVPFTPPHAGTAVADAVRDAWKARSSV